ncbi:CRISPR-associated protein Cas4 [Hazenella coriacea]|uniref:CRISPR-associated Cas4 family exonuclease n=1 Tax=Hazenella coriacea TaxID=1179467 RepID=A0A4R3L7L0_9BACL|nr:CRISPR-associated protein Cas4 [Hazenella coriacea]TCS94950.1 CRISPR-associated Cas4 family exonuclease [Hazenella coriacea]
MKITGTVVNYYIHCKRQCWLFANKLNLEDNSEDVRIGKILHELKNENAKRSEVAIENIKIDKITDDYLVEVKKSDSDLEAVRWQTLYYLKVLKDKGVERKGKIEFIEKKRQKNKIEYVELTKEKEIELEQLLAKIQSYIEGSQIAKVLNEPKCRKCAYYEYCYI